MSYASGINQRFRNQELYNNYTAEDVDLGNSNGYLITNLKYVQNYVSSVFANYLPVLNPNFSGTMSSSGKILGITSLTVPTISSNTNFFNGVASVQSSNIAPLIVGEIIMSISSIAPLKCLLCNGQSVSISQYNKLYAIIGTTYGSSASGYFNLPNFSSYFPIGGNGLINNCASSNFTTSISSTSANFAGSNTSTTPLITSIPQHTHNIVDGEFGQGHNHTIPLTPAVQYIYSDFESDTPFEFIQNNGGRTPYLNTSLNTTGIGVSNAGQQIQSIDPISNLNGVNITPPYTAMYFYITF